MQGTNVLQICGSYHQLDYEAFHFGIIEALGIQRGCPKLERDESGVVCTYLNELDFGTVLNELDRVRMFNGMFIGFLGVAMIQEFLTDGAKCSREVAGLRLTSPLLHGR